MWSIFSLHNLSTTWFIYSMDSWIIFSFLILKCLEQWRFNNTWFIFCSNLRWIGWWLFSYTCLDFRIHKKLGLVQHLFLWCCTCDRTEPTLRHLKDNMRLADWQLLFYCPSSGIQNLHNAAPLYPSAKALMERMYQPEEPAMPREKVKASHLFLYMRSDPD